MHIDNTGNEQSGNVTATMTELDHGEPENNENIEDSMFEEPNT